MTGPGCQKSPAATTSPFGSACTVFTTPFKPAPSGDHAAPSHRAMLFAGSPPAVVNWPPAIRAPLGNGAIAFTTPLLPPVCNPEPSADHDVPFQRAMPLVF